MSSKMSPKINKRKDICGRSPDDINLAIINGSDNEALAYMKKYLYFVDGCDEQGRTSLHVAASCGKLKVVKYLLANGADINCKDLESLYTPLHRAVFNGQLHVVNYLIEKSANTTITDAEGLTPLEVFCLNLPRNEDLKITDSQIYTWGNNAYYNLGQVNGNSIELPKCLEFFKRKNHVVHVALGRFHTIFITKSGSCYSCGINTDGKLGLTDINQVVAPHLIPHVSATDVAVGDEHTILLSTDNKVLTFGNNQFNQLGIIDVSKKKRGFTKVNYTAEFTKDVGASMIHSIPYDAIGVAAGKFYSCFWTKDNLYTFGLNIGQLGHDKSEAENTIIEPRLVNKLCFACNYDSISCVATSDGAIVVGTGLGCITCLHGYKNRTIKSVNLKSVKKNPGIVKICCFGGAKIDAKSSDNRLMYTEELTVLILYNNGLLYSWTTEKRHLSQCVFIDMSHVIMKDVCLHKDGFFFVTDQYLAYSGTFSGYADAECSKALAPVRYVARKKILFLNRVTSIFCDPNGKNFSTLQYLPDEKLEYIIYPTYQNQFIYNLRNLQSACYETDGICDLEFLVQGHRFFAHSFVVCQNSKILKEIICKKALEIKEKNKVQSICYPNNIVIELFLDPKLFRHILNFMYTGHCDFYELADKQTDYSCSEKNILGDNVMPVPKTKFKHAKKLYNSHNVMTSDKSVQFDKDKSINKLVHDDNTIEILLGDDKAEVTNKKNKNTMNVTDLQMSDCNLTKSTAKRYGVPIIRTDYDVRNILYTARTLGLLKLCEFVQYNWKKSATNNIIRNFFKNNCEKYTYQSCIFVHNLELIYKNGTLKGHKCFFERKSDYFDALYSPRWYSNQTTLTTLDFDCSFTAAKLFMDYAYNGNVTSIETSNDWNVVCDVMMLAHKYLITGLVEVCENSLIRLLTLENCIDLLCMANMCILDMLKRNLFKFISYNISSIIEYRKLSPLDDKLFLQLTEFYQNMILNNAENCEPPVYIKYKETVHNNTVFDIRTEYKTRNSVTSTRRFLPLPDLNKSTDLLVIEELKEVLKANPSVLTETEDDWIRDAELKLTGVTSNKSWQEQPEKRQSSRKRKSSKQKHERNTTFSKGGGSYSSLSDCDFESQSVEEFSFDGLFEKYCDEWKTVGEKRKKSIQYSIEEDSKLTECDTSQSPIKEVEPVQKETNVVQTPSQKKPPATPPPSMDDNKLFPSISEASSGKQKTSSIKMPRSSFKSQQNLKLDDLLKRDLDLNKESTSPTKPAWNTFEDADNTQQTIFGSPKDVEEFDCNNEKIARDPQKMLSFTDIVEEEKNYQSRRLKPQKPEALSLIQLEDDAISQLLEFYGGMYNPEEMVTVERVIKPTLKPKWGQ